MRDALLDTILARADGTGIIMLPIEWSKLGEAQRVIALRHTLHAVQTILERHPETVGGAVRVELDELPLDLGALLNRAFGANPHVTLGLLSELPG